MTSFRLVYVANANRRSRHSVYTHILVWIFMFEIHHHRQQVHSLGFLTSSNLLVTWINPLGAYRHLFFLYEDNQTASEEFDKLAFLKYLLNNSVGIILFSLLASCLTQMLLSLSILLQTANELRNLTSDDSIPLEILLNWSSAFTLI